MANMPRSRTSTGKAAIAAVIPGLLLLAMAGRAADAPPLEYQVKAAFLLNFTKFVEWPVSAFADDRAPLTICILGDDPFGGMLDQMVQGEVVTGRRVAVQRIHGVPEAKTCQVLYVGQNAREARQVLAGLGPGVLTVGEGENFLRDGGIIAFVIDNRRVRFDVNQGVASDAGLTLSSRLLNVARSVRSKGQETRP